jgi:hypothetical protein
VGQWGQRRGGRQIGHAPVFPYGSYLALQAELSPQYEYRLRINAKTISPLPRNMGFYWHTSLAYLSGTPIGAQQAIPYVASQGQAGSDLLSEPFSGLEGSYWLFVGAPSGQGSNPVIPMVTIFDDFALERRLVEEGQPCPGFAGEDREICAGASTQLGCEVEEADGLEYCYRWLPEHGLDDPYAPRPWAAPQETTVYTVYVTDNAGNLVAIEEVTVNIGNMTILPRAPVLCDGMPLLLSVSGATMSSQYSWSTGAQLPETIVENAGSVSVTITDAITGCMFSDEVIVVNGSDPYSIRDFFLAEDGFVPIDIGIVGEVGLRSDDRRIMLASSVFDYASLVITDEDGHDVFPKDNLDIEIDAIRIQGADAKAYITKNENFCEEALPLFAEDIRSGFDLQQTDYGVQIHLWENPLDAGQSIMFVKFFPYYNIADVSLPSYFDPALNQDLACPFYPLPDFCIQPQLAYQITKGIDNKYYGFVCENNFWSQSDLVEFNRPITGSADPLQYDWGQGSQLLQEGFIRKEASGYNPVTQTVAFKYFPNMKVYLYVTKPEKYPTDKLVKSVFGN